MRKNYVIAVILGSLALPSFSQSSISYTSRWQTKPSIGINISSTKLLTGRETDYLIEYDDQSFYWQILSVSYFFHKHWGVDFIFQGNSSTRINKRSEKFLQYLQTKFGDKYFVDASTGASFNSFNPIGGDFERGFFGLIYRIESNHFIFYPKVSIGVTSFFTDIGHAFLKEKNSNNVLFLSYDPGKGPKDHFTIAPSFSFGYKLNKRSFVTIDFMSSFFRTNTTIVKTTTDLNSGHTISEPNGYKRNIVNLGIGAGCIIVIR